MTDIITELFSVKGKKAVVTGGAKGIGATISKALIRAGVDVFIIGRSDVGEFLDTLPGPGKAEYLRYDLSKVAEVKDAAKAVSERTDKVHIIVNNAGLFSAAPAEDTDADQWGLELDVNLRAPFFLIQALLDNLKAASQADDPARVINIGSIGGLWGNSSSGAYAYGASKAALHQLTRMMASDLTPQGVNVNAIAPGFFPSDMTDGFFSAVPGLKDQVVAGIPAGRLGNELDMAGAILFLASRAGNYVSGTVLPLEGALWQA